MMQRLPPISRKHSDPSRPSSITSLRVIDQGPPVGSSTHEPKHLFVVLLLHCSPHKAKGPTAKRADGAVLLGVLALTGCQPLQLCRCWGFLKPRLGFEHLWTQRKVWDITSHLISIGTVPASMLFLSPVLTVGSFENLHGALWQGAFINTNWFMSKCIHIPLHKHIAFKVQHLL